MLDNFDESWSPWSKNTTATYSYLPPGKYMFKVKAANGDLYESEIKTYEFDNLNRLIFQQNTFTSLSNAPKKEAVPQRIFLQSTHSLSWISNGMHTCALP